MIETKGYAWLELPNYDGLCITTNGCVKNNGAAVMGKGIALEAKHKISGIDFTLGKSLKDNGNHVALLKKYKGKFIFSFPVKYYWRDKADIQLIKRSCEELNEIAIAYNIKILLPKPGCGAGQLKWDFVKNEIKDLLSDNIYIIDFN